MELLYTPRSRDELVKVAENLRSEYKAKAPQRDGGFFYIKWTLSYCGWSAELSPASHYEPLIYVVTPENEVYQAKGGSDQDGAKEWERVE